MPIATFLRCQAETCLRIARGGFDLDTAEKLRHMAGELSAKADEIERQSRQINFTLPQSGGAGWAYETTAVTVQQQQQPQVAGFRARD